MAFDAKPDRIYIEMFKWPAGDFHLNRVPRTVTTAYMLADPKHVLKVTCDRDAIDVALPKSAPDSVASVLVLMTK